MPAGPRRLWGSGGGKESAKLPGVFPVGVADMGQVGEMALGGNSPSVLWKGGRRVNTEGKAEPPACPGGVSLSPWGWEARLARGGAPRVWSLPGGEGGWGQSSRAQHSHRP